MKKGSCSVAVAFGLLVACTSGTTETPDSACGTLGECCLVLTGLAAEQCNTVVATGLGGSCASALAGYESAGPCASVVPGTPPACTLLQVCCENLETSASAECSQAASSDNAELCASELNGYESGGLCGASTGVGSGGGGPSTGAGSGSDGGSTGAGSGSSGSGGGSGAGSGGGVGTGTGAGTGTGTGVGTGGNGSCGLSQCLAYQTDCTTCPDDCCPGFACEQTTDNQMACFQIDCAASQSSCSTDSDCCQGLLCIDDLCT